MRSIQPFGYLAAAIGLIGLAISTDSIKSTLPIIKNLQTSFILIPALILIGVGVMLILSISGGGKSRKNKKRLADEEVPIYEKNKIVGYRRD